MYATKTAAGYLQETEAEKAQRQSILPDELSRKLELAALRKNFCVWRDSTVDDRIIEIKYKLSRRGKKNKKKDIFAFRLDNHIARNLDAWRRNSLDRHLHDFFNAWRGR